MFMAFRQWGFLEAVVKQVGSGRSEISFVVVSKASGSGYRMVLSVGRLGLVILFLDRVIMGWVEVVCGLVVISGEREG